MSAPDSERGLAMRIAQAIESGNTLRACHLLNEVPQEQFKRVVAGASRVLCCDARNR